MSIDQNQFEEILDQIKQALAAQDWDQAASIIETLRPPDQADIFSEFPEEVQDELLPRLNPEDSADILEEMEEEDAAEVATRLDIEELVPIIDRMEPDEAADLLGDIEPDQADQALMEIEDPTEIRPLLRYEDDTAGGLMTFTRVVLKQDMTVKRALKHLRKESPDTEEIYYLFVEDEQKHLVGVVSLRQLVISNWSQSIGEIMDPGVIYIQASADQEEVARLMARYDLLALPVVDAKKHLLGVITYDDLIEVLEEEATEDIYRLGGVPEGLPADLSITSGLKSRLPWLILNLATAMVSVVVLSIFEDTIAQVAVLAIFFPIVAGVSGSAGTQTLTVIVRGIALGEVSLRNGLQALVREFAIGLADGVVLGLLVAVIALVWQGTPMLGFVVGIATMLTMVGAGIAGALVPMVMQSLKVDPALASPILVTTITDSLGYFLYLGLATALFLGFAG